MRLELEQHIDDLVFKSNEAEPDILKKSNGTNNYEGKARRSLVVEHSDT